MTDTRPIEGEENHLWLLEQFVERLGCCAPRSVLDVGCGAGRLLTACRERGIAARGIDRAGPRLDALREAGFDVEEGTAYELLAETGEREPGPDWIVMRHVPHHLEDPARAFAEALRVARTGVLIAEPWFDTSLASQRAALALDVWEKRQHRRGGMFHAESYTLGGLLGLFPDDFEREWDVEAHTQLRPRARSIPAFEREARELVADLDASHPEHAALAELLAELEQSGLTWNGSLCLFLRRRGAPQ